MESHVLFGSEPLKSAPKQANASDGSQLGTAPGLSVAQVRAITSFYSFLSDVSRGRYHLQLSDCVADRLQGQSEVLAQVLSLLHIAPNQTRSDGRVSLALTSCTGLCDQAPSGLINGRPLGRLDPDRVRHIAALIEGETPLDRWPSGVFGVAWNVRLPGPLLGLPHDPGKALQELLANGAAGALDRVKRAGLRGRGGAGFKTALKWSLCQAAPVEHVVVCNADEGEPGTFKDRVLLQMHPDLVLDGMTVSAAIVGARRGFIYLRGEYAFLRPELESVLERRRRTNLLGPAILGQRDLSFDIEIRLGAGSYVCGEESALIESLEGRRGIPRVRPPFPVTSGYQGQPTVVNNVETFAAAAAIVTQGDEWFTSIGTAQSTGPKLFSVSGDCTEPGIYELPLSTPLSEVLRLSGADDPLAVQVGGASGACVPPSEFGRRLAYEDLPCGGAVMVIGQGRDLLDVVRSHAAFFAHESCGLCTPCRVGTALSAQLLDRVAAGGGFNRDLEQLEQIAHLMKSASHCGLGQTAPNSILDTLAKFPAIYDVRPAREDR